MLASLFYQTPIPGEETLLSLSEKGVGVILALSILLLFVVAALAVLQAHDPNVLTPAQETAARRIAAQGAVSNADFLAVLNAINDATTLAAAKPIMRQLLRLQYRVALAAGLTDAPDPES